VYQLLLIWKIKKNHGVGFGCLKRVCFYCVLDVVLFGYLLNFQCLCVLCVVLLLLAIAVWLGCSVRGYRDMY
jgi:hypothetical protein